MARLGACKTCGEEVSDEARFCPHCGQPDPFDFAAWQDKNDPTWRERLKKQWEEAREKRADEDKKRGEEARKREIEASKSSCFVATAVYGSYEHPSVIVLRRFRDDKLRRRAAGRFLILFYYRCGPWLANVVATRTSLRRILKVALDSFVHLLK